MISKKQATRQEAERLQKQIDAYEAKPVRANENRLKLNTTFDKAVDQLLKATKPPKKPKKK